MGPWRQIHRNPEYKPCYFIEILKGFVCESDVILVIPLEDICMVPMHSNFEKGIFIACTMNSDCIIEIYICMYGKE